MNLKTTAMLVGLLALIVGLGLSAWQTTLDAAGPLQANAEVNIELGTGPSRMAALLEKSGVIHNATAFKLAVRQLGVAGKMQAGDYTFEAHSSLRQVIDKIASGQSTPHQVTIPEGFTTRQIIDVVSATTALSGTITKRPGEGELFPDTYDFHLNTSRQKLLNEMAKRMKAELDAAWEKRDAGLPYNSADDLLTMASIVQKEAASNAEMPQVAGVFVGRLRKRMRLQSDPTVIYGMESYKGNIQRKDLGDDNPFNTYKNDGLPPTPICNPGRAALLAAANPVSTTALFFVADPSRTAHIFSDTYEEHQKNVARLVKATTPTKKAKAK